MNQKTYFLSVCFYFLCITLSLAQKYPYKFGKVSLAEMEMDSCSFYPDAHSMVLAEKGVLSMSYDNDKGWKYSLHTTVRKKIFNSEDSDAGNIRLRIYTPERNSSKEEINSFKAYSYNKINGEIKREKINFKDVHMRKISKNYSELNYIIPNIKDGTVIEYQYKKHSDYITNLSTWYFQQLDIPVAYSEFSYTLPEWLNYQINQLGNPNVGEWESKTKNEKILIRSRMENYLDPALGGNSGWTTTAIPSSSKFRKGVFRNILPVIEEPYTSNLLDVPARLEFQLISIDYPNQPRNIIAGDYSKFNKELMDDASFGKRFNKGDFLSDSFVTSLKNKSLEERAVLIHAHLQKEVNWNNIHAYISRASFKSIYKNKEGNVADINLSLLAAYKAHGITAHPIILSTRGNGTPHQIYPNYDAFNYVIVWVEINGKSYFVDATSTLPFGELPIKCRNSKGWLVKEGGGRWINLKSQSRYGIKSLINIKVQSDSLRIEVSQRRNNYASYGKIDDLNQYTEEELYEETQNDFIDYHLNKINVNNEGYGSPLTLSYSFSQAIEEDGIIYLAPLLMGVIDENPFVREERNAPIDFPYQLKMDVSVNIELPEGYTAELPNPSYIKLPNDGGEFRFICNQNSGRISMLSSFKMDQTYFLSTDYPSVKEFYALVADKNNELIVIRKL